ncbi:MAG: TIM barrel protein [Thermoleophilia bacterium]|nr:TIM barrel protein [Thermoleophilia bacterium]
MKRLLNTSTHPGDLEIIQHDWDNAKRFCARNGFDGYELYPVDGYDFDSIPADLVTGLHLRFYPILEPLWRNDRGRLLEIFGDDETIRTFYGGSDRQALVDVYRRQLALAARLGCEYAVFHVSQSDLESVHTWQCCWTWLETVELCAEIINEVTRETDYAGEILFENLWFPSSMRLDSPDEVALLFQKVEYPRCGLVLDTGHVLNRNQDIRCEAEGIAYLVEIAHQHVFQMDQHDSFEDPEIAELFRLVSPDYLVFEFSYRDMTEWQAKIDRQKRALAGW